jgi:hypothetical protein
MFRPVAYQRQQTLLKPREPTRVIAADRLCYQVCDKEEIQGCGLELALYLENAALDEGGLQREEARPVGPNLGAVLKEETEQENDGPRAAPLSGTVAWRRS